MEEFAVPHRYRFPRPHEARLYVCAHHAAERAAAESLTDEDRRLIAERRACRDAELARVTVGPHAGPRNDEESPAPGEGAGL